MLSALHVGNYVLIDSLEISFPEGLVIITGQTGAGKSILLGALSLVLGAKADASLLGPHGDTCVVEAEFDLEGDSLARKTAEDNDLDWDGGHLVLRRVVNRSGRSRAFVNDEPVTLQVLQELSAHLVDIHSQHQTLLLADPHFQLRCLDLYAGNAALLEQAGKHFRTLSDLRRERASVLERMARLAAEREYNETLYRQLDEARLREGEWEELEAEQQQLSHAEEIKENLFAVQAAFGPSANGSEGTDALLKEAERRLRKTGRFVPDATALADRLSAARIELADILSETEDLDARTPLSVERLEAVDNRLSFLFGLLQKHGCRTIAELIEKKEALSGKLSDSVSLENRRDEIETALAAETRDYEAVCTKLHKARQAAAPTFAAAVEASLAFLELERARFTVALETSSPAETGTDAVRFRFASTGGEPVDLSRCASGGELSRIMLSLKAMMARFTAMPTLIFDEIDTGVSGSAADKMGSMICAMGADMQVFAITHLPQVAAKGEAHYLVEKPYDVTRIRRLEGEDRVRELARMLSGATVTPEALANARSLLAFSKE